MYTPGFIDSGYHFQVLLNGQVESIKRVLKNNNVPSCKFRKIFVPLQNNGYYGFGSNQGYYVLSFKDEHNMLMASIIMGDFLCQNIQGFNNKFVVIRRVNPKYHGWLSFRKKAAHNILKICSMIEEMETKDMVVLYTNKGWWITLYFKDEDDHTLIKEKINNI